MSAQLGNRPSPLLTAEQLEPLVGIPRRTIYHHAKVNGMPCYRFGKTLRFRREEVEEWAKGEKASNVVRMK